MAYDEGQANGVDGTRVAANFGIATLRLAAAMPGIANMSVLETGGGRRPRARAAFDLLDDALRYGRQFVEVDDERRLVAALRSIGPVAARRARALAKVTAVGGVALVDTLVEAAITAAGTTVGLVLTELIDRPSHVVRLGRPGSPEVVAWLMDGRLVCSFELSAQLRWTSERLLVRLRLLETLKGSFRGKSVGVVVDHPMLPSEIRISSCVTVEDQCEIVLRCRTRVVLRTELVQAKASPAAQRE